MQIHRIGSTAALFLIIGFDKGLKTWREHLYPSVLLSRWINTTNVNPRLAAFGHLGYRHVDWFLVYIS